MGLVNQVVKSSNQLLGESRIISWFNSKGICQHGYQGSGLDGNNSKKLLDKVNYYIDFPRNTISKNMFPFLRLNYLRRDSQYWEEVWKIIPYLPTLQAFKIRKGCFGKGFIQFQ